MGVGSLRLASRRCSVTLTGRLCFYSNTATERSRARTFPIRNFLSDEWRFLRSLAARPREVGAIAPSSPALARAMAAQLDPASAGHVVELGPGTGVVTEAILARGVAPGRLTAIEFDADFARLLRARFPLIRVVEGDAFDLAASLGREQSAPLAAIVSSLPLLNQPVERRDALLHDAFARLAADAPFVQFSYGAGAPVPAPPGTHVTRAAFILANLPPASVWVYRRA